MGDNPPEERRLILIGKTGSGKSASGNTILGLPGHFLSKCSARSVTQVCRLGTSERKRRVVVVDLPGFGDTNLSQEQITMEVSRCVVMTAPGPHAFLLVVPLGRYTEEDNMAVTVMAAVFGEVALRNHTVVLFTHGDDLEESMEEYLASAPAHLKTLIGRCGGRYHVLNNRAPRDVEQVHKLLRKVEQVVDDNGGGCYTNAMYLEAEAARREEEDRLRREEEEEDRLRREEEDRIMRGCGKVEGEEEEIKMAKRRRRVLERGGRADDGAQVLWTQTETEERRGGALSFLRERGERWRDGWRRRRGGSGPRPQAPPSNSEVLSSPRVLQRVKVVVAAALTGLAVGAVCGAAVPLAAAAGAAVAGNATGLAAAQLAGASVGWVEAVGAIVAAASGQAAAGAAIGGLLGGSVGAVAGLEAASPGEGVQVALGQVGLLGVSAVGVGSVLGAGAAVGAMALPAAHTAATGAGPALAGPVLAGPALAGPVLAGPALAGPALAGPVLAGPALAGPVLAGPALAGPVLAGPALAGHMARTGTSGVVRAASGPGLVSGSWGGAGARVLAAVAEVGQAAVGVMLAGGLVVKVCKEKVGSAVGTREARYTERRTYEVHWRQ